MMDFEQAIEGLYSKFPELRNRPCDKTEEHPEEAKKYWGSTRPMESVSKAVISGFLNWPETRVSYSLERLRLTGLIAG